MNHFYRITILAAVAILSFACSSSSKDEVSPTIFKLDKIEIDGVVNQATFMDIDPNSEIKLVFSDLVDVNTIADNLTLKDEKGTKVAIDNKYDGEKTIVVIPESALAAYTQYTFTMDSGLKSKSGEKIATGKVYSIATGLNEDDKFPRIPDEELLDLVQSQTFNYFWEGAEPSSGMARERDNSGNTVTTGGTGFGVMGMIAAVERGFITRTEGLERVTKIVTFLDTKAEKFHGAYSHWIDGSNGKTIPFSSTDDGADIVETALLFEGLLSAKSYFDKSDANETKLRNDITRLYEAIEWTSFVKNNKMMWHWSPNTGLSSLAIEGWNECLIVYVLAAASPTHAIDKVVYDEGWARSGAMKNGQQYQGITLPLGTAYGGPLFLSHYSFLGINPKGLKDQYADYWTQNVNHSLINRAYCIANPKQYKGYGANVWGLTASDGNNGYNAHSPTNDLGVIAPTAAIAAMPYVPEESMQALRYYYYKLGDKMWGKYGFYDAFNLSANWFDKEYIAIDQGTILVMIENHRSGLLWNTFMKLPEIQQGLDKLGFDYNRTMN